MAEGKRLGSDRQLDIRQLILEAQHRWLRPAEICEILKNHRMFHIHSEPPNRPSSGSVFLFDRKVLRYFRKDGHNWRKKKDGKTVKEAHERLKAGSIDVLHCYYAHGEEDENFQRRSYWMLEEHLMHIVFVHYRNVKGSKGSSSRMKDVQLALCAAQVHSPVGSNPMAIPNQIASIDAESPNSAQSSEYEDTETDIYQASPRYDSVIEVSRDVIKPAADASYVEPYIPDMSPDPSADFQGCAYEFITPEQEGFYHDMGQTDNPAPHSQSSSTSTDFSLLNMVLKHAPVGFQHPSCPPWSIYTKEDNIIDLDIHSSDFSAGELITKHNATNWQDRAQGQLADSGNGSLGQSDIDRQELQSTPIKIGKTRETSLGKQRSLELSKLEGDDGLKKYDSFSRWMSRNLGEVDDSCVQSSSGICWDEVENGSLDEGSSLSHQGHIDTYVLSPSLSQDQLFSIIDFSPSWTYAGLQTKVLVTGSFLKGKDEIDRCQWSCMFGEVEVPAEVLADGILQCYAPRHRAARVPFYVTCSNRLACSEVREFEYVTEPSLYMENLESNDKFTNEMLLHIRFEKMLSLENIGISDPLPDSSGEKALICNNICFLLGDTDDNWSDMKDNYDTSPENTKDRLLQKLLKEKLQQWLLHKIVEDENGLRVLDNEGQCIIHLAAALDYDWAIEPIVAAGVGINFRDVSGWSALHWAAYYGREKTVITLISLGADPGPLTDPTSEFPSGRTPADLASSNGHKGIAGFLAKSSLTSHLSVLTLGQADGSKYVRDTDDNEGELIEDSSLKDSLSAVRTATQAFARIHQAFRVHSFHRKKMIDFEDESDLSDERVLSLVSVKSNKAGRNTDLHAAAIKIQNKFRGWKGRKDFLIIRQHVIKIQAHVRGHQVRKRKKIFWTIGIVQKAILWRRKGRGLHRLQSEGPLSSPSTSSQLLDDDNVDLLKVGRKQSEVRLEKALSRVKSMVQYPEARDQYRRLLTGVKEFKSKASLESILSDPPDSVDMDMIVEIEELIGEDAEMPLA